MLPEVNRLKPGRDFRRVFKYGKVSENDFVKIKFLKNHLKYPQFGFIVSNKFAKKAATRNLVKRRLRAAARSLLKDIKIGFSVAVWPKAALKKSSYRALLSNFKDLLIRNDILLI